MTTYASANSNLHQWPIACLFGLLSRIFGLNGTAAMKEWHIPYHRPTANQRNCVLVLDASPSMEDRDWWPSRLAAAKDAAQAFARRLREQQPSARIAVVDYAYDSRIICNLTSARNYATIKRRIDRISTRAATNITAGLNNAYDLLASCSGARQVVLLTDGDHNAGPSPEQIAIKLKESAVIDCVGIGGSPKDVNETLLKSIASANPDGSKRYRWIGDKDQLVQHFHNLAGRISRA